ncbi:baseplate J/gp47 family protein [Apilactobacillus xinyiensis]|uniref:baseplate J/gp47 family protein n=1 Tax=Apilactobacillus xinyiensis TaxID=2841032 RepID=UPI0031FEF0C0
MYGEDVNLDSNSVIGQKIKTEAWIHAALYKVAEDVYFNGYIDFSEGKNLDMLGTDNYGVTRLPATPAMANVTFTGQPGVTIPENTLVATENDTEFELTDDVVIGSDGNGYGVVESTEKTDKANVPANKITVLVDQINGVDSVINPDTAEGGAEQESDLDYQERIHLSNEAPGGPTKNGIISALMKVPGVQLVDVDWNSDWTKPNAQGDQPGAIHVYVQGGRNEVIGQTLFETYGFGIPLAGDIEYTASDIGGHKQTVRFSKAKALDIYAKIVLDVNDDFDESTSISELQQNVADYIDTVSMGEPIKYKKFIQLALNIDGVDDCSISIGTDQNNLSANDISMAKFTSGMVENQQTDIQVVINHE